MFSILSLLATIVVQRLAGYLVHRFIGGQKDVAGLHASYMYMWCVQEDGL